MPKRKTGPTLNWDHPETLGIQIISYEIVISVLLESIAKTQPSTAEEIARQLDSNDSARRWPAVQEKLREYAKMIRDSSRGLQ